MDIVPGNNNNPPLPSQCHYFYFMKPPNTLKLTSGYASPDYLSDSIQEGDYLLYGKDKAIFEDRFVDFGQICAP